MFLADPKFKNPPASTLTSDLLPFDLGIMIHYYRKNCNEKRKKMIAKGSWV